MRPIVVTCGPLASAAVNNIATTQSPGAAGTLTLNGTLVVNGVAVLDKPRQILITTGSAISFTITGTAWAGSPISETVTNTSSSVASVLSYATVSSISNSASGSSITVGTNGVADSPWARADEWALGPTSVQCTATGTVNYTVYFSNDDPNSPTNQVNPNAMTWVAAPSPLAAATGTEQGALVAPYLWTKTTLNSGTGSVVTTFVQLGVAPY